MEAGKSSSYPVNTQQNTTMNRTQDAFKTKENQLLDMFTDNEQGEIRGAGGD